MATDPWPPGWLHTEERGIKPSYLEPSTLNGCVLGDDRQFCDCSAVPAIRVLGHVMVPDRTVDVRLGTGRGEESRR